MVDVIINGQVNGQVNQLQFVLQKIYVKDVFFEVFNVLQMFQEISEMGDQLQVQLNLGQCVIDLGDDLYEVVFSFILICIVGECIVYLVEVYQVGLFGIVGFSLEDYVGIVGSYCLNLLFLYVCQVIFLLVFEGGFLLFLLQLINFDVLYVEQLCCSVMGGGEVVLMFNS